MLLQGIIIDELEGGIVIAKHSPTGISATGHSANGAIDTLKRLVQIQWDYAAKVGRENEVLKK